MAVDIVERLRAYSGGGWLLPQEAADEIERLRKRLEIDAHPYDGIDCRDATIRELERRLDALAKELAAARNSALEEAAEACLDEMEACATGKGFDTTPYLLCSATIRMMKDRP